MYGGWAGYAARLASHTHSVLTPVGGYAIGSVEGRIGVEYFDPSQEAQDKKYAFKCHRQTIEDVDHVWPVNALAFHPVSVPLRPSLSATDATLIDIPYD